MYMKKKKPDEFVPPHVLNAKGNLMWSGLCVVAFTGLCSLAIYQYNVNRKRELSLVRRMTGPKVIVVGGNVAGANAAAALTQHHPTVQVKVFEPSREQVFYSLVPLAAAGHRSYDMRCAGPNTLFASTAWTVTRDADLIVAGVDKVVPEKNKVVDTNGVEHDYDVLVMACGSEIDFTRVKGLKPEDYDKHRVVHTPGTCRDSLCTTHEGNLIIARVPPSSPYGRSHDATAIGMANTMWKFLDFFARVVSKDVKVTFATPDASPSDALPEKNNEAIRKYWEERGIDTRTRLALRAVDQKKRVAEFDDLETKTRVKMPYRLLVLDLPMRAPALVKRSQLSAPGLDGFVNVDPETLQHRKYPNIFALGDCAALNVPKSYGAIYAQVPVLTHNVTQYLAHRELNARYDGYSSFPIQMSTWRSMWPEILGPDHRKLIAEREGAASPDAIDTSKRFGHFWDDSDWVYWKGFLQGFYVQCTAYEMMHWLMFTRAAWCSRTWFTWPEFDDGAPLPRDSAPILSNGQRCGDDASLVMHSADIV